MFFERHFGSRFGNETKTVTIRGVDKHLYDVFTNLSQDHSRFGNLGSIFSLSMVYHLGLVPEFTNFLHAPHRNSNGPKLIKIHKSELKVEEISNLETLTISKADLEAVGNDVRFIFRNIEHLIFDETVNNNAFRHFIKGIQHCKKVEAKGTVSKLFLLSLSNPSKRSLPISSDTRDITIRNVNSVVYEEFRNQCNSEGENLGNCVNKLFATIIPQFEIIHFLRNHIGVDEPLVISLQDELALNNEDLLGIEPKVAFFHRINNLKFDDDVENKTFKARVGAIYECDNVEVPEAIPKLIRLARIK